MKPSKQGGWVVLGLCIALLLAAVITVLVLFGTDPSPNNQQLPILAQLDPGLAAAVARSWSARPKPSSNDPIDAVVTWVDGADAQWRADAAAAYAHDRAGDPTLGHAPAREPEPDPPGGKDELYYNVRALATFLPWVRRYYVVTLRPHRPPWWPADGRVGKVELVLVHHDQIRGSEPGGGGTTFNSGGIQRWLHRIPGLAEKFLLFDDDFFVGQPMDRSDFFTLGTGLPVLHMYPVDMVGLAQAASKPTTPNLWKRMCANTAALIQRATGTRLPHFPDHVVVPCLRSQYRAMVEEWFPLEMAGFKRFRSTRDFTLQYVLLGILHAKGRTARLRPDARVAYFHTGAFAVDVLFNHGKLPHLFCLNDRITEEDRAMLDAMLPEVV